MNDELWHRYYVAWYDHRAHGHRIRAALFGWVADRVAARLKPGE